MNEQRLDGVQGLKKKEIGVISIIGFLYCGVAAGAFGVEEMISTCGPGMAIITLIVMVFIWSIPYCFNVAELGSIIPGEGGDVYWAKTCFGEFWGFQAGYWEAVSYYVCGGTYVVLSVNYMGYFFNMTNAEAIIIKLIIILAFTILNLKGLKEVSFVSTIFSIIILVLFALVCVAGFGNWNYNPVEPMFPEEEGFASTLGNSLAIGIWMYTGWTSINQVAGEVKNSRVIPRGILIACPIIGLSYVLPVVAGVASVGHWDKWTTDVAPGSFGFETVLEQGMGHWAAMAFIVVAVIGQLALFNTNMTCGSRVLFVLADDNMFPKLFKRVDKKNGIPYISVISMAIVSILLMQMEFTALVLIQVIPSFAVATIIACNVVKCRRDNPLSERDANAFTIPGGKVGLCICVGLPSLIGIVAFFVNGLDYFMYGIFFLLIGVIAYFVFKYTCGGLAKNEPDRYPVNPKTKLAYGDYYRIAKLLLITGGASFVGGFALRFYEGSWGPEYYLEEYESGLLSNFDAMLSVCVWMGVIILAAAAVFYLLARKFDKHMAMPAYDVGK